MPRISTATTLVTSGLLLSACTYSAPDYGACDPDRPSELISVAAFEGTLQGMEASVSDVIAEIEAEHDAYAYLAEDRTQATQRPADAVAFDFSVEVDDAATFIPASEGCDIDRLELTATTRVANSNAEEFTKTWSFSLSRDTAQETFGGALTEEQAHAVLQAVGVNYEGDEELTAGFGVRFVDHVDRGRAAFVGFGVISTVDRLNDPGTVFAQYGWDAASD